MDDQSNAPTPASVEQLTKRYTEELAETEKRLRDKQGELDETAKQRDDLAAQVNTLTADNAALKAKLDKATRPVAAATTSSKARKVGPLKDGGIADAKVLLAAIGEADTVEIAISDGKSEIKGLPAIEVFDEKAWQVMPNGLTLSNELAPKIEVGPLQNAVTIAGYGLFLDDKLVAYRERFEPLHLPAGRSMSLAGDVVL